MPSAGAGTPFQTTTKLKGGGRARQRATAGGVPRTGGRERAVGLARCGLKVRRGGRPHVCPGDARHGHTMRVGQPWAWFKRTQIEGRVLCARSQHECAISVQGWKVCGETDSRILFDPMWARCQAGVLPRRNPPRNVSNGRETRHVRPRIGAPCPTHGPRPLTGIPPLDK